MERVRLGLIIPAFNEEQRLERTLDSCLSYLQSQAYSWSIYVVSDGSTDGTNSIVQHFNSQSSSIQLIDSQPNKGKGFVVRKGMLEVDAEWLLMCDADLATPIEEVEKLWEFAEKGVPVVIGSRPLKESNLEIRQPWYREFLGRAFNLAVQTLAVPGIQDTQCGFKLFRQAEAVKIFSKCKLDGFGFDFESLMIARDMNIPIEEVPIRWRHQEGSKVNLVRDGIKMLRDLVRLRLKGKRGRLS